MNALQIALVLLQTLPGLILDVEALFLSKSKSGPQKKAYVLDVVKRGTELAEKFGVKMFADPGVKDSVQLVAGELVDAIVGGFNGAGAFPEQPVARRASAEHHHEEDRHA